MGKPVIGDVVVLPFPQTDLGVGKRRPALVVADASGDDVVLCQITTQRRSDAFAIALSAVDFQHGQLTTDSYIRVNRLFTVESSVIIYTAARVSSAKLLEVKSKLRQLFA